MNRVRLLGVLAVASLLSAYLPAAQTPNLYVLAPPTANDILNSLGRDAQGLQMEPDALPDLFALTTGRIDEDPQKFIVVQSYLSGRWNGGKAVIEYARDLSYTMVSIYDKRGRRQRIYSVTRGHSPAVVVAPVVSRPAVGATRAADDSLEVTEQEEPESTEDARPSAAPPPAAVPAAVPAVVASKPPREEPYSGFNWDGKSRGRRNKSSARISQSAAVSKPRTQAPKPATSSPAPASTPAPTPTPTPTPTPVARSESSIVVDQVVDADVPSEEELMAMPTPTPTPTPTPSTAAAAKAPPRQFMWDENLGGYVPTGRSAQASAIASVPSAARTPEPVRTAATVRTPEPARSPEPVRSEPPPRPPEPVRSAEPRVKPDIKGDITEDEIQAALAKVRSRQASEPSSTKAPTEPAYVEGSGPDTGAADAWVPKATAVRPAADVGAAATATQVASIPKAASAAKPTIDDLLKQAAQAQTSAPSESEEWVPKAAPSSRPRASEQEIQAELARVSKLQKMEKPAPATPLVKRDIGNPEEGVLPINSFEKFSGARFGRHREYERRVFWGKRFKAPLKDYDFYVDEVDRKKEIHNIYYYRKGKVPKLVAQERYSDIKFLSNYDVDLSKHGAPKITQY